MEPLVIAGYDLAARKNLKPFMIPEQAFVDLLNCLVFRGRVQRKNGYSFLGRLQLAARPAGNVAAAPISFSAGSYTLSSQASGTVYGPIANVLADNNVKISTALPLARLVPGSINITVGAVTFADTNADGILIGTPGTNSGTINYATGALSLFFSPGLGGPTNVVMSFNIYPNLPVMTIAQRELTSVNQEATVFFDTTYAYQYNNMTFSELPSAMPTQWSGTDTNYFSTTSFQQDAAGNRYFWEVNDNPTFTAFNISLFGSRVVGPPSTVQVTAAGNTFAVGDAVTFVGLVGAGAGNNGFTGIVTVSGNPFTVSNNAGSTFVNGAITQGVAIKSDSLRYYQTFPSTTWIYGYPVTNVPSAILPPSIVVNALIVVAYKDRLVLLNTYETANPATTAATNYAQRARWSQIFTATDFANGWNSVTPGFGGFRDAPTGEQIIACGFVKDNLIVYFERSTWQLVYTNNQVDPFQWQRINSELGSDSSGSAVQFDNGLMDMGNVGLHVCNGQTCSRIDEVVPDEVFKIHNNPTGAQRTTGIRDFYMESVYFAYADSEANTSDMANRFYPNRIMCYNYRNETFSFFDDHVTAWGTLNETQNLTWAELNTFTWEAWNTPWNSGVLQNGFPSIVFGNQQGFIEQLQSENSQNGQSLYVDSIIADPILTNGALITSQNHNLSVGQYVQFLGLLGGPTITQLNGVSFEVVRVGSDLAETNGATKFAINLGSLSPIVDTYLGAGTMVVLTNVVVTTKMFTPFWKKGKRFSLRYIDMLFDTTVDGEMTVDIYNDFSDSNSMTTSVDPDVILGTPQISTAPEGTNLPFYSFQQYGEQIWKRFYTCSTGETFQIVLSMNDTEMRTPIINQSDFALHGMIFFFDEVGEFI